MTAYGIQPSEVKTMSVRERVNWVMRAVHRANEKARAVHG